MTPTYPYFARAVERLNPGPGQKRQWDAENDLFYSCLARLDEHVKNTRAACAAVLGEG